MIKVKYTKLGKQRAWGLSESNGCVFIDERLKGKKALEILIHECLHYLWKDADEDEIENKSIQLTNVLWKQRYRRIEENKREPLQDGSM